MFLPTNSSSHWWYLLETVTTVVFTTGDFLFPSSLLHLLMECYSKKEISLFLHLLIFIYLIMYLYQYGLLNICFILWTIIHSYHFLFCFPQCLRFQSLINLACIISVCPHHSLNTCYGTCWYQKMPQVHSIPSLSQSNNQPPL